MNFRLPASRTYELATNLVGVVTDRAPPSAPQLQYPGNPVYFDPIGRSCRFGVRMKL